ncbi:DUF1993 domain-containing protein [Aestuariivirga litoralis]|uniref:DUF1993 domain-containing protein n=1 Tax=Aestuariivirga litoralis TaxID=2650924 RepID=UPI0018C55535|nr:DUF1993 domain-containing protein [Aestuariivirga litoralis]MBG1231028.1 DUF1993 domain-containing protein [Aestuariivirga litoralis]
MTALYDQSVPFLIRGLESLSKVLKKAEAQADERKWDKDVILNLRLAPDMLRLISQVQLASDFGKGAGARLSGTTNPSMKDEEKTFEDLQARIGKTIDFLKTLKKEDFDPARTVTIKLSGKDTDFDPVTYFNAVAVPQFYFHATTAYNILRSNGFALGKLDFMGRG